MQGNTPCSCGQDTLLTCVKGGANFYALFTFRRERNQIIMWPKLRYFFSKVNLGNPCVILV